jgi:hypothetical protein
MPPGATGRAVGDDRVRQGRGGRGSLFGRTPIAAPFLEPRDERRQLAIPRAPLFCGRLA